MSDKSQKDAGKTRAKAQSSGSDDAQDDNHSDNSVDSSAAPDPLEDPQDHGPAAGSPADSNVVSLVPALPKPSIAWMRKLKRSGKAGPIKKILFNAVTTLQEAPEFKDALRYNGEALVIIVEKPLPWDETGNWTSRRWGDHDDKMFCLWMQNIGIDIPHRMAGDAADAVAQQKAFYPIKTYLESLVWDGQPRAIEWLTTYLGAASTEYSRAVGPRWLISAVARILDPGCKADCLLILESEQGTKKSSALRALAGSQWFSDQLGQIGNKDTVIGLAGPWIIEIPELEDFKGMQQTQLKAFISRQVDRFRPLYARIMTDIPRRCVFIGTTNEKTYLTDSTGNRRYWPIAVQTIKIKDLAFDRDQIWAEAVHLWRSGENWWLETQELQQLALAEQDLRYAVDEWENTIHWFIEKTQPTELYTIDLLTDLLEQTGNTKAEQMRVATILQRLGWIRKKLWNVEKKISQWAFVKKQ